MLTQRANDLCLNHVVWYANAYDLYASGSTPGAGAGPANHWRGSAGVLPGQRAAVVGAWRRRDQCNPLNHTTARYRAPRWGKATMPSVAAIDIMSRLKHETAGAHRLAESSPFERALVSGRLPRPAYVEYLAQRLAIHAPLES